MSSHMVSASPSGNATTSTGSGSMYDRPYRETRPSSSLRMRGFTWMSVWPVEQVSTMYPGKTSSVVAPPPGIERASTIAHSYPAAVR